MIQKLINPNSEKLIGAKKNTNNTNAICGVSPIHPSMINLSHFVGQTDPKILRLVSMKYNKSL